MNDSKKDTIYIDVEEELASIIDRLISAKSKIVAVVPPNKNAVLKSIVNLKLIQKAADQGGKLLVVVTSDKALIRLCGAVGMHIAEDLRSKPYIPKFEKSEARELMIDDNGDAVVESQPAQVDGDAANTVDDSETDSQSPEKSESSEPRDKKPKSGAKFRVPDFAKFRKRFFLLILPVLLLPGGVYYLFKVAPKATVEVKSEITTIDTDLSINIVASLKDEKLEQKLISGEYKEIKKQVDLSFDATGTKDLSSKARGVATIVNCTNADETIAAGTAFSVGDKTISAPRP